MSGFPKHVVELIIKRDRGRCARCGVAVSGERGLNYDLHHRCPRGMGGSKEPWVNQASNGLLLCRPCHQWVESHRTAAEDAGFIVRRGSPYARSWHPENVWIDHALHGRVLLTNEGRYDTQRVRY